MKNKTMVINDITNINLNSGSFDFLNDEPKIYSLSDLKEVYSNKLLKLLD